MAVFFCGNERQGTEDRRQETGDRRQKTEDRRQKTEDCPMCLLVGEKAYKCGVRLEAPLKLLRTQFLSVSGTWSVITQRAAFVL